MRQITVPKQQQQTTNIQHARSKQHKQQFAARTHTVQSLAAQAARTHAAHSLAAELSRRRPRTPPSPLHSAPPRARRRPPSPLFSPSTGRLKSRKNGTAAAGIGATQAGWIESSGAPAAVAGASPIPYLRRRRPQAPPLSYEAAARSTSAAVVGPSPVPYLPAPPPPPSLLLPPLLSPTSQRHPPPLPTSSKEL